MDERPTRRTRPGLGQTEPEEESDDSSGHSSVDRTDESSRSARTSETRRGSSPDRAAKTTSRSAKSPPTSTESPRTSGLVPFERAQKAGKLPAFEKRRTKANRRIAERFREVLGPEPTKARPGRTAFESEPSIYDDKDNEESED